MCNENLKSIKNVLNKWHIFILLQVLNTRKRKKDPSNVLFVSVCKTIKSETNERESVNTPTNKRSHTHTSWD